MFVLSIFLGHTDLRMDVGNLPESQPILFFILQVLPNQVGIVQACAVSLGDTGDFIVAGGTNGFVSRTTVLLYTK